MGKKQYQWTKQDMLNLERFLNAKLPMLNIHVVPYTKEGRQWMMQGDDLDVNMGQITEALSEYFGKPISRSDLGKLHYASA